MLEFNLQLGYKLTQKKGWDPPLANFVDYLNKISIKTNVATDEGNSRNEMWHWTNDEIGVAVQSWLWVRVELMAW